MRALPSFVVFLASALAAFGQASANYKLTESSINAGGDPRDGTSASSTRYRIRLDAIGDIGGVALSSASHRMAGGFVALYPPPGEVLSLTLAGTELRWSAEPSVGHYQVYRDLLTALPGTYGTCVQAGVTDVRWTDAAVPPARNGFFYLVTARNRLDEEGTKGTGSSGAERPNPSPCP